MEKQIRSSLATNSPIMVHLQQLMRFTRSRLRRYKKLDKNVIVFTTHKAGSMVVHQVLRNICEKNNIAHYSDNQEPDKQLPYDRIFSGEDFIASRNGCFGPVRFFIHSTALASGKIVLHLRDPRDVLTSMFFSYCFMHPGEIPPNTGYRKEVAEAGIDKFVLDMSDENFSCYKGSYGTGVLYGAQIGSVRDRYATYLREVVGRPNVILLSYEEMVLNFPGWLSKLLASFELRDVEETHAFVTSRIDVEKDVTRKAAMRARGRTKPFGEDLSSHRRKATPGDYKEKLKPETIATLNTRFSAVLDALGYSHPRYETAGNTATEG